QRWRRNSASGSLKQKSTRLLYCRMARVCGPSTASFSSNESTTASPVLGDGIDQREAALFHLGKGALECRRNVRRLIDRAFPVAAHGAGERGKIRRRPE